MGRLRIDFGKEGDPSDDVAPTVDYKNLSSQGSIAGFHGATSTKDADNADRVTDVSPRALAI